jgi:hypothetical protein
VNACASQCHIFVSSRCYTDIQPPKLACPSDIVRRGQVIWSEPDVRDNSGRVSVSVSHSMDRIFPVGDTFITYDAVDPFGNMASCTFKLTLLGKGLGLGREDD